MKIQWCAWYTGGRIFRGTTPEEFAALPDDGVLAVVLAFNDGTRRYLMGDDFYWTAPGCGGPIYAHATHNVTPASIAERYPGASIKRGRWTDDGTMRCVQQEMERFCWLNDIGGTTEEFTL